MEMNPQEMGERASEFLGKNDKIDEMGLDEVKNPLGESTEENLNGNILEMMDTDDNSVKKVLEVEKEDKKDIRNVEIAQSNDDNVSEKVDLNKDNVTCEKEVDNDIDRKRENESVQESTDEIQTNTIKKDMTSTMDKDKKEVLDKGVVNNIDDITVIEDEIIQEKKKENQQTNIIEIDSDNENEFNEEAFADSINEKVSSVKIEEDEKMKANDDFDKKVSYIDVDNDDTAKKGETILDEVNRKKKQNVIEIDMDDETEKSITDLIQSESVLGKGENVLKVNTKDHQVIENKQIFTDEFSQCSNKGKEKGTVIEVDIDDENGIEKKRVTDVRNNQVLCQGVEDNIKSMNIDGTLNRVPVGSGMDMYGKDEVTVNNTIEDTVMPDSSNLCRYKIVQEDADVIKKEDIPKKDMDDGVEDKEETAAAAANIEYILFEDKVHNKYVGSHDDDTCLKDDTAQSKLVAGNVIKIDGGETETKREKENIDNLNKVRFDDNKNINEDESTQGNTNVTKEISITETKSKTDKKNIDEAKVAVKDVENYVDDENAKACMIIEESTEENGGKGIIERDIDSGTEKDDEQITNVCKNKFFHVDDNSDEDKDEHENALEVNLDSETKQDKITVNKDPVDDKIVLEVSAGINVQLNDIIDLVTQDPSNEAPSGTRKRMVQSDSSKTVSGSISEIDDILDGIRSFSPTDHGYCKNNSADSNTLSPDQLESDESAPPKKKEKLEAVPNQSLTTVSYLEQSETHKQRMDSCPPLTQEHIDLMLSYLENPKLIIKEEIFLMQLKLSNFPRIKRYSIHRQLERWSKNFDIQVINGETKLVLRLSKKLVLAMERYGEVIKEAHENSGTFTNQFASKDDEPVQHNCYFKTFCLIESKFGVGGREFGMSKYSIYVHVANCSKCSIETKKLPPLSKVLGTNEKSKHALNGLSNSSDDLYNNVSLNSENANAPVSMLWDKPSPGSIWHNQKGLASETDPYPKLLGVIQEIGLDLVAATQGDNPSKSKFITKLYCAVRLIQEMKTSCEKNKSIADVQFMVDYLKLQESYVRMGRLDLFLYDVNLLAIKYNLANSELFMQLVSSCVSKISKNYKPVEEPSIFDTPIDIPEYLIDSISCEETAGTSGT